MEADWARSRFRLKRGLALFPRPKRRTTMQPRPTNRERGREWESERRDRRGEFRRRGHVHGGDDILGPRTGQGNHPRKNYSSGYRRDWGRHKAPCTSSSVVRFGFRGNCDGGLVSDEIQKWVTENEYLPNTYRDQSRRWWKQPVSPGRALVNDKRRIEEHSYSLNTSWDQQNRWSTWPVSPGRALVSRSWRKLLVLDLNGLLADVTWDCHNTLKADRRINGKAVFKRPFCDDFLKFCFSKFDVGIWSSRKQLSNDRLEIFHRKNVDELVCYLLGDMRHNLLFCWDQSKCTFTGFRTIENDEKPLVLKELKKLWNKEEPDLPWKRGFYTPANTLLVDDSPYKALCNLPHTAVFPHPYHFTDENDSLLGPAGELRVYLEGLAMADHVQRYVRTHPFGQPPITSENPSWKFYQRIIEKLAYSSAPG